MYVRIMPIMLIRNGRCVKGVNFSTNFRDTGWPLTQAKIYDAQDADELLVLDIEASLENRAANLEAFRQVSENSFMPLTLGGGIKTTEDIHKFLLAGADKVSINTGAVERPELIKEAAEKFGSQCIVISIDAKKVNGKYKVFTHSGKKVTNLDPVEWAKKAEQLGAGEILITSIDHEGTKKGFDLDLLKSVSDSVNIPVIAGGGAGKLHHLVEAIKKGNASAVAVSSIFSFTEQNIIKARTYMKEHGINVRPI